MEQRIFHGQIKPEDLAQVLLSHFNRGNLIVQKVGESSPLAIQIQTKENTTSGGDTALSVILQEVPDGISVRVGQQAWFGIAASLGLSAMAAIRNPLSLFHRLDDIAQDLEYIQLGDEVWRVLEENAKALGSSYALSDRLNQIPCLYCRSANPAGESNCIACGAPLGDVQPSTCKACGYVVKPNEIYCPNCGKRLN